MDRFGFVLFSALFTITLLLIILFLQSEIWFKLNIPKDWVIYTNREHHYVLAYPSEWFVNDCGNGEIAITAKPIHTCYYPTEASEEYLHNLHFQIFLPKQSIVFSPSPSWEINRPNKLKEWHTVLWEDTASINSHSLSNLQRHRSVSSGATIPENPDIFAPGSTLLEDLSPNSIFENEIFTHPKESPKAYLNSHFMIGYLRRQNYTEHYSNVISSVRFF